MFKINATANRIQPPQTLLELRMLELMPEEIQQQLQERFGDDYSALPRLERLILATAAIEQVVSHSRIAEISTEHSFDITQALQSLVKKDMLKLKGHGRGAFYHLAGASLPTPADVFGAALTPFPELPVDSDDLATRSDDLTVSSDDLATSSDDLKVNSDDLEKYSDDITGELDDYGRWASSALPAPAIHDLEALESEFRSQLENIAYEPLHKGKVSKEVMRRVILQLCAGQFVTRNCLAQLVDRTPDALRQQYLSMMVREKKLSLAFPQNPNDNRQAYIATASLHELATQKLSLTNSKE